MVSTLLVLVVAAVSLTLTWRLLRGRNAEIQSFADWEAHKSEVDIEMFRVLVDPAEERFLQRSLSQIQFRSFLRKRIAVALRALVLIEKDAALLTRLGELATGASSPDLAREAQELTRAALQLRMNLWLMKLCLCIKWLFPAWSDSVPVRDIRYNALLSHLVRVRVFAYREARSQG